MALNNFHTPGPQTDVRNLMLAQLNQSSLANNIFNSALGEMNKFDTGARNLNTQKLTRDIANMSLSELEDYYNNDKTAIDILNEKDGTGFMYNETDPNLLNMVNQRDNDYKTAKNNAVFHELQQLTPQQIIDSGNLYDKFSYADKLTPLQEAWLTNAKGSAQQTLRTQALNELSPEEIADAATIGNIKLAPEYGSFNSQDAEYFRTLQGKYRGELDSKNYGLAMQLLNSIPNPLDRARLVANPSEFKARLEQSGIKFRNGETFTKLMSDLGATYNDPTKKTELDNIFNSQYKVTLDKAIKEGKSLPETLDIIAKGVDNYGNPLSVEKQKEFTDYIFDNSDYLQKYLAKEINKEGNEDISILMDNLLNTSLSDQRRAESADALKNQMKDIVKNTPKHLQKTVESKMNAYIDSMLKTSNETAKAQTIASKTEARNKIQGIINNDLQGADKLAFERVMKGTYTSRITAKEKENADVVKGNILDMLSSDVSFSNYAPLLNYLSSNMDSPFASYILDSFYDLNKTKGYNDKESISIRDNINNRLKSLMKLQPYMERLEQSNINYMGN
ncbi:MAG: hypothetical protein II625_02075 [Bacilli bacterium]|nr:hypothetical protein [Bacilli bacterium]